MARKKLGLVVPLPKEIQTIFTKVLQLLEGERTVRVNEHALIAQLAQLLFFQQQAVASLLADGLVLISQTNHGSVQKANPAADMLMKCTTQINALATKLGLDQKAFDVITGKEETEEEDDPITDALAALNK